MCERYTLHARHVPETPHLIHAIVTLFGRSIGALPLCVLWIRCRTTHASRGVDPATTPATAKRQPDDLLADYRLGHPPDWRRCFHCGGGGVARFRRPETLAQEVAPFAFPREP